MNEQIATVYQEVCTGVPIETAILNSFDNEAAYYRQATKQEIGLIKMAAIEYRERLRITAKHFNFSVVKVSLPPEIKMALYKLALKNNTDVSVLLRIMIFNAVRNIT